MTRPDALSSKGSIIYEEPPLLEDVGVDPELIADKIISIIKLETPTQRYIEESDLFGPSMIAFLLGLLLMLSGKMHFGDIYALFVLGNILIFVLFNLMSSNEIISLYAIMSTLGYCLFPMLLVGLVGIFMKLQNSLGILLSLGLSGWCAYSASAYIEILIKANENDRKMLIGYPLYLYYASFAMITIFWAYSLICWVSMSQRGNEFIILLMKENEKQTNRLAGKNKYESVTLNIQDNIHDIFSYKK